MLCERNGRYEKPQHCFVLPSAILVSKDMPALSPYAVDQRLVLRKGNFISLVLSSISPCITCDLLQDQALPTVRTSCSVLLLHVGNIPTE